MLGKDFMNDDIRGCVVLHVPHSSILVPDAYNVIDLNIMNNDIIKLTDWATDLIFSASDVYQLRFPYSRLWCDVERFKDDLKEPMSKFGRGMFYTHSDNGKQFRIKDTHTYDIVSTTYDIHHQELIDAVSKRLFQYGTALIIDCHSFSNTPFYTDEDNSPNRPDICIGVDSFHTPLEIQLYMKRFFESFGYNVEINSPYVGTIIPTLYYQKDKRVQSIMIEINRKLYMKDDKYIDVEAVVKLQNEFNKLLNF